MSQDNYKRFNGNLWFEKQVRLRTRAALTERGSHANSHSAEYQAEYRRQFQLFRAERKEVKRQRAEKHAEREAKHKPNNPTFKKMR